MAHLYDIKGHGYRIKYRVFFTNGTHKDKTRIIKKKGKAQLIFREASDLEARSRGGSLSDKDILFFINQRYITREEGAMISIGSLPVEMPWKEALIKYEDYSRENCRPYTHSCNSTRAVRIVEYFEALDISPMAVTEEDIQAYSRHRKAQGRKAATIRKEIHILQRLLDPVHPENPARKVDLPQIDDEKLRRVLNPEEIRAFLDALDKRKELLRGYIKPLTLTYLYAGLRPSELIHLTPADVDLRIGKIKIQAKDGYKTKTGKARSVDIHSELKPHLKKLKKDTKAAWLFGGDRRFCSDSVSRAIRNIMAEAGIKDVTPYCLRHSFISYLLEAGASLREVMELAGHKRISTTAGYLHTIKRPNSPVLRINFSDIKPPAKQPKKRPTSSN